MLSHSALLRFVPIGDDVSHSALLRFVPIGDDVVETDVGDELIVFRGCFALCLHSM
jgi:hypothetical protein